jgi:hypothetical protein
MLRDHIFLLEQPRHRSLPASQSSACQRAHVPMAAAREGIGPSASARGDRPTDRSNPRRIRVESASNPRRIRVESASNGAPTDRPTGRPGSASANPQVLLHVEGQAPDQLRDGTVRRTP